MPSAEGVAGQVPAEILDSRAKQVVQELKLAEYVLSNELVSMALAMVSGSTQEPLNLLLPPPPPFPPSVVCSDIPTGAGSAGSCVMNQTLQR